MNLFDATIDRLERENAELRAQLIEARLALASGLGYMRSHRIATGFHGMGVRKLFRETLERDAA